METLRPAILILKKRSAGEKYFFFEDHRTALDYAAAMRPDGWHYVMIAPTIYRAGELPPGIEPKPEPVNNPALYERTLFDEEGA